MPTVRAFQHWTFLRTSTTFRIAEARRDVLAEVVMGLPMPLHVAPQISARRLIHIRNLLLQRISLRHHTFKVIRPLSAPVVLLPRLLQIVSADSRRRPDMSITRHLA